MLALVLLAQLAGAGSFAGSGGINSWKQPVTVISSVTASPDANTVVLSWTTDISADSRASCGSQQSHSNGDAAAATSHTITVSGLTPSTAYTCTVQSGSTTATVSSTTTALATTVPATGLVYGAFINYNTTPTPPFTMTGDTYYNAVSNDGANYMLTMDTSGWNGGANFSASLMLAKFSSLSPLTGTNVNLLSGYKGSALITDAKAGGLMSIAGSLYVLLNRITTSGTNAPYEPITAGSIIVSPDHGANWNNIQNPQGSFPNGQELAPDSATLWPQGIAGTNFSSNHFVMYGADDGTLGFSVANNRFNDGNEYVYVVSLGYGTASQSSVDNNDNAYLMRVPRSKIGRLNPTDYQYFVSGDGNLDTNWTNTASSAGAILTNTGKLGWSSINYIPALNRYLWMTFYYPSGVGTPANSVQLGYESPTPWGPWTLIATNTFTGTGYYSPIILHSSALAATLSGTAVTIMSTQNFTSLSNYNLFYQSIAVTH